MASSDGYQRTSTRRRWNLDDDGKSLRECATTQLRIGRRRIGSSIDSQLAVQLICNQQVVGSNPSAVSDYNILKISKLYTQTALECQPRSFSLSHFCATFRVYLIGEKGVSLAKRSLSNASEKPVPVCPTYSSRPLHRLRASKLRNTFYRRLLQ